MRCSTSEPGEHSTLGHEQLVPLVRDETRETQEEEPQVARVVKDEGRHLGVHLPLLRREPPGLRHVKPQGRVALTNEAKRRGLGRRRTYPRQAHPSGFPSKAALEEVRQELGNATPSGTPLGKSCGTRATWARRSSLV